MKLGNPVEITSGIYQLRTIGARVTVITAGDGAVLVDAGTRGSLGSISGGLRAMGLALDKVRLIVLTHSHPDHAGGLGRLVEATSAKVAAHRSDARIIGGLEPVPSPFQSGLIASATRPFMHMLYGAPVDVDYPLEDGDHLPVEGDLGDITVIHTPGHTPGSICLYVPSKGVLIVGDALQFQLRRLGPPAASVTEDSDLAQESLKKLLPLEFEIICFSHFPPLKGDARGALRRMLEKSSRRPASDRQA